MKKLEDEIKRTRDERDEARSQVTIASFDFESRLEEEKAKFSAEISDLHSLVNGKVLCNLRALDYNLYIMASLQI